MRLFQEQNKYNDNNCYETNFEDEYDFHSEL